MPSVSFGCLTECEVVSGNVLMTPAAEGYDNVKEQADTYDEVMRIIKIRDGSAMGIIHDSVYDDMKFPIRRKKDTCRSSKQFDLANFERKTFKFF